MVIRNRKLNRLKGYNYSSAGFYFVTINCKDKIPWFGKIVNNDVILNPIGKIIEQQLIWLDNYYDYVDLDTYIIMPDHLHIIVHIDNNYNNVGTGRDLSLLKNIKIKSLSELIGAYKTTSSKLIRNKYNHDFKWQRSFHDRIIRNEFELNKIRNYILMNPYQLKK